MSGQDSYQLAYERERQARQAAEKLLDEKTREVQSSMDMISHQFDNLMLQKKELQYLLNIARLAQDPVPLSSAIKDFILQTLEYLGAGACRWRYKQDDGAFSLSELLGEQFFQVAVNKIDDFPWMQWLYDDVIKKSDRKFLHTEEIDDIDLKNMLLQSDITGIALIPIKRYGRTATLCEFFIVNADAFDMHKLDQAMISSFQISVMLERRSAQKKLEKNFKEIKLAHDELKQAQTQLVQSEKMASIGQLAAGVAHEINNPVGFVLSNMGTIKEYCQSIFKVFAGYDDVLACPSVENTNKLQALIKQEDIEFIRNDVSLIIKDSEEGLVRVRDIVANLKSFARVDSDDNLVFDINECVDNTLKVVWNELKYQTRVIKELSENLPKVTGQSNQIGQVIMNLLMNAKQAIEGDGEIHIRTYLEDERVCISVADNGKGIPENVIKKIFDPFFTTKPVGVGTGLGLSISYGIVEKHRGDIDLHSVVGQGTTFIVRLPAVQDGA
jgi:two-component system, NtrC family, sensor kinase